MYGTLCVTVAPRRMFTEEMIRRRNLIKKVALKIKNIHMVAAWNKWFEAVLAKRELTGKLRRALRHWNNSAASKAWNKWRWYVEYRREYKKIIARWKHPMKVRLRPRALW